jgi:hypothetical protein
MKRLLGVALGVCLLVGYGSSAKAGPLLFELATNVDGTVCDSLSGCTTLPAGWDSSGFDFTTGLGTLKLSLAGGGLHFAGLFVDHEIDETINTFYNEYGEAVGSPTSGLGWEIDEPGYVFGDIYANFVASTLDGTNAVPDGAEDDVSMALGWNFLLAADETATLTFLLSEVEPASGFYLKQIDPDSPAAVYFSSSLDIAPTGVPDAGATAVLLMLGGGLVFAARRFGRR